MAAYRSPAERPETPPDPPPTATFQVRTRSWPLLLLMAGLGATAAWLVVVLASESSRGLAAPAFVGPALLALFALSIGARAEGAVRLDVTAEGEGSYRVSLRRRWGFFPWAAPLVFSAPRVPSLRTEWKTGRFSSKYGAGREYRAATLVLEASGVAIDLPPMGGVRRKEGERIVIEHEPALVAALDAWEASLPLLREVVATEKSERRATRKRRRAATDDPTHDAPAGDRGETVVPARRVLVGRTEGAHAWSVALATLGLLLVPITLGAVAALAPRSGTTFVCAALVGPLVAGILTLFFAATFGGSTLHFESRGADGKRVVRTRDLYLLGPIVSSTPYVLGPKFTFRVKSFTVGEDEERRYALVDAETGKTLLVDDSEEAVRRFGNRLGRAAKSSEA